MNFPPPLAAALLCLVAPSFPFQSASAGQDAVVVAEEKPDIPVSADKGTEEPSLLYKIGYALKPVFGGPNSPEGQLEDDDRVLEPAFRLPGVYDAFEPWRNWKRGLNENQGLQFTGHYTTLAQYLSDSLTDEDKASSGVFRATVKWTLLGQGTVDTGSIVAMVDHRHKYRELAPANLGAEAGYLGVTGTLYSDVDWVLTNLNWQQGFNDGNTGLLIGRYDPNDYLNILGYVNPWTTFQNVAILLDPSIAFPDSSWGIGAGHWLDGGVYLLGGVNDANGTVSDDLEFFKGGSEFFSYGEIGWSPSKADRYFKNVNVTLWHVDERKDAGVDESKGVALAANWTFNDVWMPFVRAGFSSGFAPLYNTSATIGFIRKFTFRSDLLGLAVNWGEPSDSSLRDQTTVELFWRFQFAQNFALTPSVQLLLDPALNPATNTVWVFGFRTRLNF